MSAPPRTLVPPAPLGPEHDLARFSSGRPELDGWLRDHASVSEGRSARTYVVCAGRNVVVGYYCIATGSVERGVLPSKMKRARGLPHEIPVAIIGRLARDESFRGTGLGRDLLQDALRRILSAAQIIGIRAVLVHALDEQAAAFWRSQDFIESRLASGIFFLPLETVIEAI